MSRPTLSHFSAKLSGANFSSSDTTFSKVLPRGIVNDVRLKTNDAVVLSKLGIIKNNSTFCQKITQYCKKINANMCTE